MPAAELPSGHRIGPYRIVSRVGAGGMGVVYKGWDPRLERDIAIKLLHPELAGDADRQRRLVAEGRAASTLNHPNILRVYDADVDGDSYYLVSEWLEGKSLRDELTRGPVPLKRLLDLAVQIADGLAAAHAAGIVHRDIKPENVMLARDGTARIVDFGLARTEPDAAGVATAIGQASTVTASLDGGLSGTPAYMSPEQARGSAGDYRTDQFSFGALLYEMATGKFAFRRNTLADTLAAVIHEEPRPISELNPRLPAAVRWIVEQCLAKDAGDRYAATEDLARELRRVRDRLIEALAESKPIEATRRTRLGWTAAAAAAGLVVAAFGFAGGQLSRPDESSASFVPFATSSSYEGSPSWSADGQTLAYVADVDGVLQVFVRRLGDAVSHQVTRGRFDAHTPFWAPDGQRIYFISLAGDRDSLWSVGVAGGRPELLIENVARAAIDPDGARLALLREGADGLLRQTLWWSSPPGAEPAKEERAPFDRLQAIAGQLAFSRDGQLLVWTTAVAGVLASGSSINSVHLFDAGGAPPRAVLEPLTAFNNLGAISWLPDSRHVAVALPDERLRNRHLWLADTRTGRLRQLTATHTNETAPAYSPAAPTIAYATEEVDFDLLRLPVDGARPEPVLVTARNEFAPAWSPLGDQFAFVTDRSGSLEIWSRSRDGQWERPIVTASDFGDSRTDAMGSLAYSPDGRTLAYQRSSGGAFEIWLSPATGGTPVRLLDPAPGVSPYQDSPSWSPDGSWISYTEADSTIEQQALKKIRVGSKEPSLLADRVMLFSQSRWSPDGEWVLVQLEGGLARVPADGGTAVVFAEDAFLDFTWAPDSRRVFALADSETAGHFALVAIDSVTGATAVLNADLGSIPIANQPIRGLSYLQGEGFLTSMASARSDIWLLERLQPQGWFARFRALIR